MNGNKTALLQGMGTGFFYALKNDVELLKLHLCIYVSLSAVFGFVMAQQMFSRNALLLGGAVLILSCGAAVLNNIQDREYDSFFPRTQDRSLPQKRVTVHHAAGLALLLIGCGLSGVLAMAGPIPFFWSCLSVLSYNGLYTPLKKRSLLAIIPGSVSGMLPPLIGWTTAGKPLYDPILLMILSIFGLWQIPHFFIILLKIRPKHTQVAGVKKYPCFTHFFSENEIKLQILIWTSLYSLALLLFLMNVTMRNQFLLGLSGFNAVIITFLVSVLLLKPGKWNIGLAFAGINLSMLFFMAAGICDSFFITTLGKPPALPGRLPEFGIYRNIGLLFVENQVSSMVSKKYSTTEITEERQG